MSLPEEVHIFLKFEITGLNTVNIIRENDVKISITSKAPINQTIGKQVYDVYTVKESYIYDEKDKSIRKYEEKESILNKENTKDIMITNK